MSFFVTPAKAGVHAGTATVADRWTPAFAGVTGGRIMPEIIAEWVHPIEWGKAREFARAVHDDHVEEIARHLAKPS